MTAHADTRALKQAIIAAAGRRLDGLMEMARALYDHPELSGEEVASARLLASALEQDGFAVDSGAGGLPTAFVARHGSGGPVVAFLAEYDALPGIGHGCGHNIIGTAAVGAGLVLAEVAGSLPGQVRVIGTPAEETLGGKVIMVEEGVFDDVDAALMVHPGFEDRVLVDSLACQSLSVTLHGRAAHAVAHPEKGINALDPLLALFAARDALLRQSRPGLQIVGVITEGGVRPNVVPEKAVGRFSLRAPTRAGVDAAVAAFTARAQGLAATYGCRVEIEATDRAYDEMTTNMPLADAYRENLRQLGVAVNDAPRDNKGSLDMGNVSSQVPSLHPFVAMAPPEVASHTRDFAEASVSDSGRAALERSVMALAMTGLDFLADAELRRRAKAAHGAWLAARAGR